MAEAAMSATELPLIDKREELAEWLSQESHEGMVVRTRLKASDRVIARVTDGIYRQPASALRELISNAWDADANVVTILTDAPRFSRIYVRDDGAGMSYETLSRLLHSIGGSAKRREEGQELGVTASDNVDQTPGGRPLIGKIGIGLFSVSQLSRSFRIVTKVRGEAYRLIAEVKLRAYSEDESEDDHRDADDNFINGDVFIIREPSIDIDAHGTDIVLNEVKPRVRDLLRSADRWRAIDERAAAVAEGDHDAALNIRVEEPQYHAGWIENLAAGPEEQSVLTRPAKLPWDASDPAEARMGRLMDAVEREFTRKERPDLANTLDTYLETLWTLGLSVPVRYVDSHPFDLTGASDVRLFWLSNKTRGQAQELQIGHDQTVRAAVEQQVPGKPALKEGLAAAAGSFRVDIDGVELRRPIRFKFIKTEKRGLEQPMLFVGKYSPSLDKIDSAQRGGGLSLESYLFWNGRVVPKENNGVLIRIRGASGALFDPTFFKYQVSEQTRLRQITSEIFIQRGLDAALNIDRESYNFSHPHVQLVGAWLHRAIRQLTNKHKDISQRQRVERRAEDAAIARDALSTHSQNVWRKRQGSENLPEVAIAPTRERAQAAREDGYIALSRSDIASLDEQLTDVERNDRDAKAKALVRVLAAYDVLEDRPYDQQQELIEAIMRIFFGNPRNDR
ncbi:MAG: ATP-binding protein [Fulvimarina manganoxydans]|uniref:ATP-binding protein n=1 Tax=Fulvimarina manganoxydans TaxID=937218 RepID=UPI002352A959|nr:ATP-binding protein [Fulvimarina manganoxydans]MCK5932922.1 ATP-binding protein [Fulvimarina manganoxydans]